MALRGESALDDAAAKVAGGQAVAGSAVELAGATVFETVFELSMSTAIRLVPDLLDMEFPPTARFALWEWPTGNDETGGPKARLGEVRLGCRRGAARCSWPVASVFQGDPAVGQALRRAGVCCEEGVASLALYHDAGIATFAGASCGEVRIQMRMGGEVDPAGLQWNVAPLLCPLKGDGRALGRSPVRHRFTTLRTGRPALASAGSALGPGAVIGRAIGGLVARAEIGVGPLEEIGAARAAAGVAVR
jgi:hypothetical protein